MRLFVSHPASRFSKLWCLLASSTLAVLLCPSNPVKAQTVLPSFPGLNFQTSGPSRGANIGDWYTTNAAGKIGAYQPHQFFINVTQADIANSGGSVTISIIDAGNGGPRDEVGGGPIGTGGANPDPIRFRLLDPTGAVLSVQTPPVGTPAVPTNISFPAITVPGVYTITSETGASPISGDATANLNDDDNGFQISVTGDSSLLIGQLLGTFQQDTGASITVPFYALIPPGTTNLFFRNFDLDDPNFNPGVGLSYTSPTGAVTAGTTSGNSVWNNSGDLNNGGDSIPVSGFANAGIWTVTLSNYAPDNQTLLQANTGTTPGNPIPLFDRLPARAGNFTITPDTTRATTIGTAVDHPFTVTNNFFTADIVNLTTVGTNGSYTAVLLDSAGNPLVDTEGNGVVDTGIIPVGQTRSFILRVTPNAGAPTQDVTRINGISFIDTRVRQQSGSPAPIPQFVTKTTTIAAGTGTIGDLVFNDPNGNGVQDPGETGVAGVTLTLSGTDTNNNPVSQTVVTNAAGNYQFTALNPGTYTVTATPPPGSVVTNTNPQTVTLTAGQSILTADFGIRQNPGTIGDTVFNDLNGNGIQDPGEAGIARATLTLRNSAGTIVGTLVTDANGNYQFTSVPPGNNYTVTVTPPAGFSNTTPLVQTIATLNPGQNVPTIDFGLRQLPGTIGDFVFNDVNNDGVQDPSETAGISGVTLTLRDQAGTVVATTTTNAAGTYQFTNVIPGNYTVTATAPAGSRVTTPTPLSVTLGSGQTIVTADFGVFAQTGTLGDRVFNDFDNNGIQNGTEPGIAGVTVTLTGTNIGGTAVNLTTTTSATGTYSFTGLPASNAAGYTVTISNLAAGFTPTTPTGAPSLSQTVVFPAGANIDTVDFGVRQPPATIGNLVFNDLNGNGVADPGEPPLPNIPVTLLDPQGNPFATTTTNATGNFTFSNVPPGIAFTVVAAPPAGFTGTTANPVPVPALTPGQVFNVPIGLQTAPGTIGNLVFNDLNGNGISDPGDTGIGGATVTLRNAAGVVVGTTVTDANGNYSFLNVPPGNYTVTVTPPGGASATTPTAIPVVLGARQSVLTANFGFRIGGQGLRLVKRITNVTRNGASIPGFDFSAIQDDPSTLNDNAPGWAQIPLRGQINLAGGNQIRTGDEITYTVYFLADGATPAFGTNLCDQIPAGTGFLANTAEIQRNNTAPTAGGTPFSPLAPLPTGNACQNQTNPNGSVIFGLGDLPNTAGNNFGFVRFRVRIN